MPQFDVSTFHSQIFWLVVSFSLLYLFVSLVIAPSVSKTLDLRSSFIEENLKEAEEINKKLDNLSEKFDDEMLHIKQGLETTKESAFIELVNNFAKKREDLEKEITISRDESLKKFSEDIKALEEDSKDAKLKLASMIIEKLTSQKPNMTRLQNYFD